MGGPIAAIAGPVLNIAGGLISEAKQQMLLKDKQNLYELLDCVHRKWHSFVLLVYGQDSVLLTLE